MLSFALCDDNNSVLERLAKMLETIFINNELDACVAFKSTSGHELLSYFEHNQVNVLLLDVELKSDISGLELAEKIRAKNKSMYFIFTTGHLEYILPAFKVKTFDYLPKPITLERLEETILRLMDDVKQNPKKFIRLNNKNTIINQDSIYYIQKDGMKLVFHTENRLYEVYSSFNKIQPCLPDNFVRCHKSFIVNMDKILDIKSDNTVLFDNKNSCCIGPKYKNNFMEVFKNGNFTNYLDGTNN